MLRRPDLCTPPADHRLTAQGSELARRSRSMTISRVIGAAFVVGILLGGPAAAQGFGRGPHMVFAPHPSFFPHRAFFPNHAFVHHRFFGSVLVAPPIIVPPYPVYPYYPYYYPPYAYPPYP